MSNGAKKNVIKEALLIISFLHLDPEMLKIEGRSADLRFPSFLAGFKEFSK